MNHSNPRLNKIAGKTSANCNTKGAEIAGNLDYLSNF